MRKTALIMAGGYGERFWPRSRKNLPKQFLSFTNDKQTMIQLTVERILPIVQIEDIFISTNKDYKLLVKEQLPKIPEDNILCEPVGKNTAPCIGLGAIHIIHKYKDALMMVFPSDHLIKDTDIFIDSLKEACQIAEENINLVTIGIIPNYPETGYGYIKLSPYKYKEHAFAVECFVEKPSVEVAKEYLETERYLWNSGIFVWKASSILKHIEQFIPNVYTGLLKIKSVIGTQQEEQVLEKEFEKFPSESIDSGIMEKSKNIFVLLGKFGWDDVGSWLAVERLQETNESGNVINGNVIAINSSHCIIEGTKRLIATIGLEDLVIVDSEDVTLVCKKDSVSDIKKMLESLRYYNQEKYL